MIGKGTGNQKTNGDYPDYSIVKIGQNTEKSPGDMSHSNFSGIPSAIVGVKKKNSQRSEIIIIMIIDSFFLIYFARLF